MRVAKTIELDEHTERELVVLSKRCLLYTSDAADE